MDIILLRVDAMDTDIENVKEKRVVYVNKQSEGEMSNLCKHLDGDEIYCLMLKCKCVGDGYCIDYEKEMVFPCCEERLPAPLNGVALATCSCGKQFTPTAIIRYNKNR